MKPKSDAWSWDVPFSDTTKKVAETGNKALISCVPHKIGGASAGWTRAVAILDTP